ncbi:DUF421 domain-containing protein [Algoriphagus ratkowskyi]|nr:YetF domain-containing protein [Algoriphagus ratkowskyi]TXD76456.1 DUF421 domain-containing protein [Algoriphagus ratkowskyi]
MDNLFYSSWESTIQTIILTVLGYIAIVLILRVSGKRTLSKMNAFDFVVTVALGSCLASISLNKNVSLLDGVLSFSIFIFLQFIFSYLSVHLSGFRTLITSKPTIIFHEGSFLEKEMKKERITKEEILNAGRANGLSDLDDVYLIIFETTGNLSIIEKRPTGSTTTIPSDQCSL